MRVRQEIDTEEEEKLALIPTLFSYLQRIDASPLSDTVKRDVKSNITNLCSAVSLMNLCFRTCLDVIPDYSVGFSLMGARDSFAAILGDFSIGFSVADIPEEARLELKVDFHIYVEEFLARLARDRRREWSVKKHVMKISANKVVVDVEKKDGSTEVFLLNISGDGSVYDAGWNRGYGELHVSDRQKYIAMMTDRHSTDEIASILLLSTSSIRAAIRHNRPLIESGELSTGRYFYTDDDE